MVFIWEKDKNCCNLPRPYNSVQYSSTGEERVAAPNPNPSSAWLSPLPASPTRGRRENHVRMDGLTFYIFHFPSPVGEGLGIGAECSILEYFEEKEMITRYPEQLISRYYIENSKCDRISPDRDSPISSPNRQIVKSSNQKTRPPMAFRVFCRSPKLSKLQPGL